MRPIMKLAKSRRLRCHYQLERLDLKNNRLYITQLKMSHTSYGSNFVGAIAVVDTNSFTLSDTIDINTDPYDIAVDDQGYIFISPGSGQWGNLKVYSFKDKKEQNQSSGATSIYERTNIAYNAENIKNIRNHHIVFS